MSEPPGARSAPVLIADDEELVRIGIRHLFLKYARGWNVMAETSTVEETLRLAAELHPMIAIVDQCLPGGPRQKPGEGVVEMCRRLSEEGVRVVVFTESGGTLLSRFFRRSGAIATVGKNHALPLFLRAVETAASGGKFFAPSSPISGPGDHGSHLTARQAEIIRLLALGRSNPEIAHECGMSVRTVESHRARIRRQTGADSLSELTRFAHENGLIC